MQTLYAALTPYPKSKPVDDKVVRRIQPCYTGVAVSSMKKTAEDTRSLLSQSTGVGLDGLVNCHFSVDHCRHASPNDVATVIYLYKKKSPK